MKNQLLQELTVLHQKVADIKVYDRENASLLRRYAKEFEATLTHLLTFNADKFKNIATNYQQTLPEGFHSEIDVHDDTTNHDGFYDNVAHLNNSINDAIEVVNGLD